MKSVTVICVLLVAAVASAELRMIVDPAVPVTTRDGKAALAYLVRAAIDPGDPVGPTGPDFRITAVDVRFDGPMVQAFDWNSDDEIMVETPQGTKSTNSANWKDSRFIINNAILPVVVGAAPRENILPPTVQTGAYVCGIGNWLGGMKDGILNRAAFGPEGGATAMDVAVIVQLVGENTPVHLTGNMARKDQVGLPVDMWIGVPEPASIGLLAIGGIAALIRRRRA